MLDDENDPLSVAAGVRGKAKPVPARPIFLPPAADARPVGDETDAFKQEVERMVRASLGADNKAAAPGAAAELESKLAAAEAQLAAMQAKLAQAGLA